MTEQEKLARAGIEKTLGVCAMAGDSRKADAYSACFTKDGVLELQNVRHEGREAIHAFMAAPSVIPQPAVVDAAAKLPGFVSHHLTTCRIELSSDTTAQVRTYWLVTTAAGLDHNGYYDDRFECVGSRWLIAHRRPRTLWTSPDSLVR